MIVPLVDISTFSSADAVAYVDTLMHRELKRPFELETGFPFRVTLLRVNALEHVMLWTFHHIAFDGWSMGVFIHELTTFYQHRLDHDDASSAPLEPLQIQIADYAIWQREHLDGKRLEAQLAYWRKKLQGAPTLLELPIDHPRPRVQASFGRAVNFQISLQTTADVKALCRKQGATLFMAMYGALACLFSRYSGSTDLIIGMVNANRNRREAEGLIGFFVNILPMRTRIEPKDSYRDLITRMRADSLEAHAHQDLPFEQLVEAMNLPRSLSHTPLVQVIFGMQNAPLKDVPLPHLKVEPLQLREEPSVFDLTIPIWEEGEILQGQFRYNSTIFEGETVTQMTRDLVCLIQKLVAEPDCPVLDIPLHDTDGLETTQEMIDEDEAEEFNF
jgi:Condensation domain